MMGKDASISIRLDSKLKEQTENVLEQFGMNMTIVVNMLFRQIVREQAIPLSMTLNPRISTLDELNLARAERIAGCAARTATTVEEDMECIVAESEIKYGAKRV